MSTDKPKFTAVPNVDTEPVEKQSLVKRGVHFVKSHKKAAIAVAALTGLAVVSALATVETADDDSVDEETVYEPTETTVL